MEIGESFVGTDATGARVTTVLGTREGPVGAAWATALATRSTGHEPFLAVVQPGLPVKPFTLVVPGATVEGAGHRRLLEGPAHAGVAAGVADAVAAEVLTEAEGDELLCIATVWVDPRAEDVEALFANHREATRSAIVIGRGGLPAARDAVAKRAEAWNPSFRPR